MDGRQINFLARFLSRGPKIQLGKAMIGLGLLVCCQSPSPLKAQEHWQSLEGQIEVSQTPFAFKLEKEIPWDKGPCSFFAAARFQGPRKSLLFCLDEKKILQAISLASGGEGSFSLPLPEGEFDFVISDVDADLSEDLVLVPKGPLREVYILRKREKAFRSIPLPPNIKQSSQFPRAVLLTRAGLHLDLLLTTTERRREQFHLRLLENQFVTKNHILLPDQNEPSPMLNVRLAEEALSLLLVKKESMKLTLSEEKLFREVQIIAPNGLQWEHTLSGDFNGDGASDILSYSGPIAAWWMVSLADPTLTPRSVGGLPRIHPDTAELLAVDLDGDGQSAFIQRAAHSLRVYRLDARPLPDVLLSVDGKFLGKSDTEGHFRFPIPAQDRSVLELRKTLLGEERLLQRREIFQLSPEGERLRSIISPEKLRAPGPKRCFGISPNIYFSGSSIAHCPPEHYILAVDDALKGEAVPGQPTTTVNCCPLPEGDSLTEDEIIVKGECPAGSFATGMQTVFQSPPYPLEVSCGKLLPSKLHTSASQAGKYFGPRASSSTISPFTAPVALSIALGRSGLSSWDVDGCVGEPWGAMLAGVLGPRCAGTRFVQALREDGKQEKMFPDCHSEGNRFDPEDECQ